MEILLYQAVIVATLVGTRLLAPARLTLVSLIWTGMTLVNLFWPPLVIIQLFVVWGTFSLLKPARPEAEATVSDPGPTAKEPLPDSRRLASSPPVAPPPHGRLPIQAGVGSMSGRVSNAATATQINEWVDKRHGEPAPRPAESNKVGAGLPKFAAAVDRLNGWVASELEAKNATLKMVADYDAERIRITTAMETAERQLKHEDWLNSDEALRDLYEEEFARLSALLGESAKVPLPVVNCANLTHIIDHEVPGVSAAIARKYASVTEEYSVLLKKLVERFRRQPAFRAVFEKELLCLGGARILDRIKCFEAGGEWRHPDVLLPQPLGHRGDAL